MKTKNKFLLYWYKFAEVYPVGCSKYALATMGSLVGILIGYFLILNLEIESYLFFLLIVIIVSYFFVNLTLNYIIKRIQKKL